MGVGVSLAMTMRNREASDHWRLTFHNGNFQSPSKVSQSPFQKNYGLDRQEECNLGVEMHQSENLKEEKLFN